ncbi:beta-1,4-N-acetylgalactosaminyltransferase bre-4-like [Daphnia carinata]|uniref:beta-1,4-N-acetylgalactosaminyltransferase bre-4-like n=1 Tax=Daphnia carinata TaxID=120202 RepID=UPI00257A5FD2|nr:beta-1,4-N-acetylgalactosaminyltransferase bre-4-like [Daphnia carinata]
MSTFIIYLVLMFHLSSNAVHFGYFSAPSLSFYQQLHKKTDVALLAQTSRDEGSSARIEEKIDPEPKKRMQRCNIVSPKLIGWTNISAEEILKENDDVVERKMAESGVKPGGKYKTKECQSRSKIAIVVPLRNRTEHLKVFVRYMHSFLQRQQLDYAIIVAEQTEGSLFNRGALMNVGFKEAQLLDNFECFFFHDVDNLPENDGNPYSCPEDGKPRHMTFSLSRWANYKPTPAWYFGGVTALTAKDFQKINGFSNVYWGWGGEDDDLLRRIRFNKMKPTRALDGFPSLIEMARYKTLTHKKADPSPIRHKLLREGVKRLKSDGLTDLTYKRLALELKPLYTRVLVELKQPTNSKAPGQP